MSFLLIKSLRFLSELLAAWRVKLYCENKIENLRKGSGYYSRLFVVASLQSKFKFSPSRFQLCSLFNTAQWSFISWFLFNWRRPISLLISVKSFASLESFANDVSIDGGGGRPRNNAKNEVTEIAWGRWCRWDCGGDGEGCGNWNFIWHHLGMEPSHVVRLSVRDTLVFPRKHGQNMANYPLKFYRHFN